jgi:hypothetical protein
MAGRNMLAAHSDCRLLLVSPSRGDGREGESHPFAAHRSRTEIRADSSHSTAQSRFIASKRGCRCADCCAIASIVPKGIFASVTFVARFDLLI